MRFRYVAALCVCLSFTAEAFCEESKFTDVEIEKPFSNYLLMRPLLMEVTGAKVIREKSGETLVMAVASTVLKDNSPTERLRAERVCRIKALASVVGETQGVQVCQVERSSESVEVVIDAKGETARSVSDLLQVTRTKVEGIAKDMPVVGRWRSKDGAVFYLAIGAKVDPKDKESKIDE